MISPEFEIARLSVWSGDPERAAAEAGEIIRGNEIDWEDLYARALYHSVRPQAALLSERLSGDGIPAWFREKIAEAYRDNLYDQLRYAGEFLRLKGILDSEGITAVPFKGFWLAHEMYGNLAWRESVDIDLMIHPEDLDAVKKIMEDRGYVPETSGSDRFSRKMKAVSSEFNFDKYDGEQRLYHVEYHWKIGSVTDGLDISLRELAAQVTTGSMQGLSFPVFTPSATLLLAIMHHGGKDPLIKLKHVSDTAHIIERKGEDLDWEWNIRTARRYNMERPLYNAVKLASDLAGIGVPDAVVARVRSPQIQKLAAGRLKAMAMDPGWWHSGKYRFNSLVYHLRTRPDTVIRARMTWNYCRSAAVRTFTPKWLLSFYLKKRYQITN